MKKLFTLIALTLFCFSTFAQNIWQQTTPTGDIPTARYGHSMVTINGIVYLYGGMDNSKIFDLKPETYIAVADNTRYAKAKILLKSYFDTLGLIQTYNAENREWLEEDPINTPPPARFNHKAIVKDGKMYIFFGENGNGVLGDIWEYNPITKEWVEIIPNSVQKPADRSQHAAVIIGNKVYIIGGKDGNGNPLSDCWRYDFATNNWQQFADMPSVTLYGHTAVTDGSNVYVYGGLKNGANLDPNIRIYNPGANSWTTQMPTGNFYPTAHASTVQSGNIVYIFGGYSGYYESQCFKWNLTNHNFEQIASGPATAFAAAAIGTGDTYEKEIQTEYAEIVFFGGKNNDSIFGGTWHYITDIEIPESIEEIQNTHIHIYPNPATHFITIEIPAHELQGKKLTYQLCDINGKLLQSDKITSVQTIIDIEQYASAVFFVRITEGHKLISVFKRVKQ